MMQQFLSCAQEHTQCLQFCQKKYIPNGHTPNAFREAGGWGGAVPRGQRRGVGWHEAMALVYLPLAGPVGPSPLHILTLCGSERVALVSTEPPDDVSCLTTLGVGRPGDGLLTRGIQRHTPSPCAPVCASAG